MSDESRSTGKCGVNRFAASRRAVWPLVCDIEIQPWGWQVDFNGTQAELLAAGVAEREMFVAVRPRSHPGLKPGAGRDEYGDPYEAKRGERDGAWVLTRYFSQIDELDLSKIKKGRDAIATVDAILAKLTAGA